MKKARMKRSLALLLAVVMCIGLLPMGALAARIEGDEIAIDAPSAAEDADLAVQPDGSSDEAEEPKSLASEAEQETDNIITPTGITAGSYYGDVSDDTYGTAITHLIDNSGMSDADAETKTLTATADTTGRTHWHTGPNPNANAWVKVDLGDVYALDEMWVWNFNPANAGENSRGFKNVKIEYATEESGPWTELTVPEGMTFTDGDADYPFQFAQASGVNGQSATNLNDGSHTPVKFNGVKAQYVRITADPTVSSGTWNGDGYYGLSELRFTEMTAVVEEVKPVHYYTFDEAADAAAADHGTKKADGTKTAGIGSADGKAGKAAQFDGASYIDVDDNAILNGEQFTVTAWVNWNGGGQINTIVATSVSGFVEGTGLLLYVHGGGGGVVKAGDGVGAEFNSAGVVKPNEWTHVAFVKDGSTVKLYLNGQADGESNNSQTGTSLRTIWIGANHGSGGSVHNFHGAIDELKIFDQVLTAEQIAAAMELPKQEYSSLKTHEVTIADADWGKNNITIEANLVEGDSIDSDSIKANGTVVAVGSGVAVNGNTITLDPDFLKNYSAVNQIVLEVTFAGGNKDTFTIKRGDPTKRFGWSLQKQATGEDVAIPEGWITQTDNGISVNHSKMIVDSNHQPWVLYYADGDKLTDSVWEFDMTFTDPDSNQVGFINIAPAPRTVDGNNYEGFAIDTPAVIQRTGRKDGSESYAVVSNEANLTFAYGTTYHFRIVTEGNHMTTYVTVADGEEQKLTEFDSPIGLGASTCGFRIWRGGKTIKIENMTRKKLVKTGFENTLVQIEKDVWGTVDAALPYNCEEGDSIQSVANGNTPLTTGADYTTADGVLTLKKEYITTQQGTFSLKVTFTNGHEATLWIMCHEAGVLQEYIWTPDQGIDSWVQISGDGIFEMGEDKAGEEGLHVKGKNLLVNTLAPMTANGEVELTFQLLSDAIPWAGAGGESSGVGTLFRAEDATHYQAVDTNSDINAEPFWDFCKNGNYDRIIWDGHHFESMESVKVYDELQDKYVVKDIKLKVRYYKDSITLWIDDEFCHTQNVANATETMGNMGLVLGRLGDILVKKAVFREIAPFEETTSTAADITIEKDGLTVRLDGEFPRVIDYTLNGKKMNGAELSYHYATINNTDYPATATTKDKTADSVTYHVVPDPERTGVTFDVKFTVKPDHILEMLILNINEPTDEMVFGIGLPQLPMISANSGQTGAALNASWINKNSRCYQDRNIDITRKDVSTTAAMGVTLPIISADGLSASMFNNVLIGGDEYNYKGFELADGKVSVGVWNTEWVYRGMDNKKMMPFPSEPKETELYCRVVITEDTNDDGVVNWQDGGNALKKLTDGITPGADQAARSFFHVGYNFSSGTQQPFLQVADNMKRLSNLIDGFGQQLIFKGYANEGHDSGHSDFQDINRRAGGAEDMNVAIAEADKINSNLGIHINEHEIYPEAKMFNDHTAAGQDAWYWMDHSKILRRYVDMLDTTMENHFESRMEQLFTKTPDLDFVYVDCWGEDRWGEKKLIGTMLENGAELFGNENAADFTRFGVWTHSTAGNSSAIHQFVYNSQKDIYGGSGIYWGGYNRAASMMSWQHNNNINTLEAQFFTNQLPQKYLMCHDVRRIENGVGYPRRQDDGRGLSAPQVDGSTGKIRGRTDWVTGCGRYPPTQGTGGHPTAD